MNPRLTLCCLLSLAVILIAGCKKDPASVGQQHTRLFQSAPPQIKAGWDTAIAAIKTNGYATAILSLKALQQGQLTPEQLAAVNETVTLVSDRMYEASNKGDARAAQAIQELRKSMGR